MDTVLFTVKRQSICVPRIIMKIVTVTIMTKYFCVATKLEDLVSKRTYLISTNGNINSL